MTVTMTMTQVNDAQRAARVQAALESPEEETDWLKG